MQRRLGEEYERCTQYLDPGTRRPLVAVVEAKLLQAHLAALLDKGFEGLVSASRLPDLARLYRWVMGSLSSEAHLSPGALPILLMVLHMTLCCLWCGFGKFAGMWRALTVWCLGHAAWQRGCRCWMRCGWRSRSTSASPAPHSS